MVAMVTCQVHCCIEENQMLGGQLQKRWTTACSNTTKCRRAVLNSYFGYDVTPATSGCQCACCDICAVLCACSVAGFHFSAGCPSGFAVAVQQVKGHYKHLSETEPHLSSLQCQSLAIPCTGFSIQWTRTKNVLCFFLFFFFCFFLSFSLASE